MDLIGPLFCQVCNVAIPHESARDNHNQGKRHQLALHAALTEDNDYKSSVFSVGWPNAVKKEEIHQFMEIFGSVKSHYMPSKGMWMITKYDDAGVAQDLIKRGRAKFKGKWIKFSAKKRTEVQPQPPPQEEYAYENILKIIFNQRSFGDEILTLCSHLQPNTELEIKKYLHLCADLEKTMQQLYPNSKVHPFGSTITGLAFPDSDIDAYIGVPNPPRQAKKIFYVEAITKSRDVLNHSPLFTNIVCIPRANTPIVKCVHVPTGLKCDFNFKNMLGVCNSYLIQFIVRLDNKLKLCLLVLKFWTKLRMVGGTNTRLTNYALTIMFIYYLQQAPYNLPSIRKLQENPMVRNIQYGWNGGFDGMYSIDLASIRNASLYELLKGFFVFYLTYNYDEFVICPYLGENVQKTVFQSLDTLPAQFELYRTSFRDEHLKVDSLMCVQDPFEHNRNLVGTLGKKFVDEYLNELKRAVDILEAQAPHLLYNICIDSFDNISQYQMRAKMPKVKNIKFLLTPGVTEMCYELKLAWFQFVDSFLVDVLTDVYNFTINVQKDDDSHDNPKKMKMKPDLLADLYDPLHISVSGLYNLWDARNIFRDVQTMKKDATFLEHQIEISKYIQSHLLKDVTPKKPIVNFNITVNHYIIDTRVMIILDTVDKEQGNDHYGAFATLFSKMFINWLRIYTNEKNGDNNEPEKSN